MNVPKTIILSAHGSRDLEALATFQRFKSNIQQAFPNHTVILTFADYIHKNLPPKWKDLIQSADQIPAENAVTQSLLVASGLLGSDEQISQIAAILETEIVDPKTAYVLCGHGSVKQPEKNEPYFTLHDQLQENHANVFLATLDGPPGHDQPLEQIRAADFERVHFIPLLFASGIHAQRDIMGDQPESWKNQINLPATIAPPLGDRPEIAQLFIDRILRMLP